MKKTDCKYYEPVVGCSDFGEPELEDEICWIDGGAHYNEYDCDGCTKYDNSKEPIEPMTDDDIPF